MLKLTMTALTLAATVALTACGGWNTACVQGHDMGSYIDKYCYNGWSEDSCQVGDDYHQFYNDTSCEELGYDVECSGTSALEDSSGDC